MDLIQSSSFIRLSDSEFQYLVQFVRNQYGIDLTQKRHLIEARLASELRAYKLTSYKEYIAMLDEKPDSDMIDNFINKITTNYSYFNREMEHYNFLINTVVSDLMKSNKSILKIWSAGCSTGQEPYNIAMAVDSALGSERGNYNISITATDVSTRVLGVAQKGEYKQSDLGAMPAHWQNNYMVKLSEDNYRVKDSLRRNILFRRFNLMDPFPQAKYDVIFCRNVMIYFKQETSQKIIEKFSNCLSDRGYLFIGHSETIPQITNWYDFVKPSIYQKKSSI